MAINLKCSCGQVLSFQEQDAGKKARCPACGGTFVIPQVVNYPPPDQPAPYGASPYDRVRSGQLATQAKIGLWSGILSIVFFALIFVISIAMTGGAGKGFDDGFKRGYKAGQEPPASGIAATG
jgi:hypothetical protein